MAQVGAGIGACEFGAFKNGVEKRGHLHAALRFAAVMVLSSDDRTSNGSLGMVVAEGDAWVLEEKGQALPKILHVRGRLADGTLRQLGSLYVSSPGGDGIDDGPRALCPERLTLF